ncbi:synaptotagmin-like protein 2 isoform 2-T2 [Clarias gariepinus]|uniref:synaptotagmin-like protein 2 isoform X2 n=1 Tax=Clarias gariepinus TaxID=13013 RepID=UPI00234E0F40|nr:synaptotagmin-like protein 2 isoform X2 [Clarias gariepinus]
MIDLSYLTEEEQEMILSVLKRDADLKHKEEQRIKKLQKTERDKQRLKYLTGEWFYETKSNRHRDKIHGSDIIRASMTRRKPVTIMELTQIWPGQSSFLKKQENNDVFIPPELSGIIGEPSSSAHNRENYYEEAEYKPSTHPQTKPRLNPFNSKPIGFDSAGKTDGHQQVPGNQQPEVESLSIPPKPTRAAQIPPEEGSEGLGPVGRTQKQACIRPLSLSKSLEDLATLPSNERWNNEPRIDIIQTVEEAPHALSLAVLDPEQSKRLSVSVPAFMHEQVSGSVTNIYGTDFGYVDVKGTIQFAINYVNKLGELHIFIVQCRDLAAAEHKRNRSDPYVKCYLLPDKARMGKRKTSVKKKTLNPTYNEILRYKIPLESLKSHTLNVSVWHHDTFGRNSFLGEVNVDLSEWDNNTQMLDRTLKGRTVTPSSPMHLNHNMAVCGNMRIALRFLLQTSQSNKTPQTGEMQVWVKECTDLPFRRGTIDPFVKCSILPDSHQNNRQKTRVVKKTANPVFNHIMVYDGLRAEDLKDTCIELTVWDHDRLSNNFLGGTRLGLGTGKIHDIEVKWMDSNSTESALWRRMIESKNEWVEHTIPLRMLIMTR